MRKLSIRKSIAVRMSVKRFIRYSLGLKVLWGYGWVINFKKYMYNKIYNKIIFSIFIFLKKLFK